MLKIFNTNWCRPPLSVRTLATNCRCRRINAYLSTHYITLFFADTSLTLHSDIISHSFRYNFTLTSPTSSGRPVGIVHSRTKATELIWMKTRGTFHQNKQGTPLYDFRCWRQLNGSSILVTTISFVNACIGLTEFLEAASRGKPFLWSSGQSSWLQIQKSGFDSCRYQIFWEVVCLEWNPLSLVSTAEELLQRKCSGSGIENREYGRRDPSRWPRVILYRKRWH
jgi:hypothetical protein